MPTQARFAPSGCSPITPCGSTCDARSRYFHGAAASQRGNSQVLPDRTGVWRAALDVGHAEFVLFAIQTEGWCGEVEARPAHVARSCAGLSRASRLGWHGRTHLSEMAGTTLAAYGGSPGHDKRGAIRAARSRVLRFRISHHMAARSGAKFGIIRNTRKIDISSAAYEFEVPKRARRELIGSSNSPH